MYYHRTAALLMTIMLVGCQTTSRPNGGVHISEPADSRKQVLHGVQYLTHIYVATKDFPELRAELMQELHRQLPQLDTAGPADGWTLEFQFGTASVPEDPPRSDGSGTLVPARQCRSRIIRKAVVDGRETMAVAYEGPWVVGRGQPAWFRGRDPREKMFDDTPELLHRSVDKFAEEWRASNVRP